MGCVLACAKEVLNPCKNQPTQTQFVTSLLLPTMSDNSKPRNVDMIWEQNARDQEARVAVGRAERESVDRRNMSTRTEMSLVTSLKEAHAVTVTLLAVMLTTATVTLLSMTAKTTKSTSVIVILKMQMEIFSQQKLNLDG